MDIYVPPHLRQEKKIENKSLKEPKPSFTETCDGIEVTTNSPYGTIESLKELSSSKNLPYFTPTVIQKYAIPAVLKGHPIQCRAPTGMGKTMCFLLPLIENNLKTGKSKAAGFNLSSTKVCIISPTRELCEQIKDEGLKIDPKLSIECVYGGHSSQYRSSFNSFGESSSHHKSGSGDFSSQIIVAAPGKLLKSLEDKKIIFKDLTSFVLDEADKLLEMGFEQDIRKIKSFIPENCSVFLFSATYPKNLAGIINDFLPKNRITIEIQKETLNNIKQTIIKTNSKDMKLQEILKENIKLNNIIPKKADLWRSVKNKAVSEPVVKEANPDDSQKILVFAEKKTTVDRLEKLISSWGFPCVSIHGDKDQPDRQIALNKYKSNEIPILVATSVAARGIDVKDIKIVLNFDFPRDTKEYIHRIGRTGRQGKEGIAISFMDNSDCSNWQLNSELVGILKESQCEIPSFLQKNKKLENKKLENKIKLLNLNESTETDQSSYLSTEKDDTEDDVAGEW
jgi:superfamily II DNA/RNA helicase